MELGATLGILWRRRRLVALGAIVAIALAIKAGPSPTPASGLAKTRVVLDTTQSQLITQDPSGSGSLPWRATIAALRLSDTGPRARIAEKAGIPVEKLTVIDPE